MLTFLFTSYRESVALYLLPPLLIASVILTLVAAFTLGKTGKKIGRRGLGHREAQLMALVLSVVALTDMHLGLLLGGRLALDRRTVPARGWLAQLVLGPPLYDGTRLIVGGMILLAVGGVAAALAYANLRDGGRLRELANRLRDPQRRREELGSAHFCYPGEFVRLQKPKGDYQLRLLGAFYGKRGRGEAPHRFYRLDKGPGRNNQWPWVALSAEDQARGLSLIGPPGTGKSQAGILPIAADSMAGGQSVIVLDPQNELTPHLLDIARVTRHRVIIHDPTDPDLPRFNIAHGVANVSDAQAIAGVITGALAQDFWSKSARNLLAGCLLRLDSLGHILSAFDDLQNLADTLMSEDDGAANATRAFVASVRAGDRSAPGVLATLQASTLSAWAEPRVQDATADTDFDAAGLIEAPTLLILRCPGRYMKVYGPYLGAVLQRLMLALDTIGEAQPDGRLPRPVKVIIDEFPLMGKLNAIVEAVNLMRKRQLSIVIAAQTIAQFELIYGKAGSEALIAGMATQIYFGSCDAATARFVSNALGKATERVKSRQPEAGEPQLRQRDLMSIEEIIAPPVGNCTILHRYATTTYATQVVLPASLTYYFQRQDWERRIARAADEALVMELPL
ncbi:MAG: type IV secretory system conjugative DNA transfer family protein, partial [Anaerolineae bacterium]